MRHLFMFSLAAVVFSHSAQAEPQDHCRDVLELRAFDESSRSVSVAVLEKTKNALCSSTFESLETAENYARNGGWSLSWGGLGNTLTDAKNENSSQISISESDFCNSARSVNSLLANVSETSTLASPAVRAWSKCMSDEKRPHLTYRRFDEDRVALGEIHTGGLRGLTLRGITISPSDGATCSLTGASVDLSTLTKPIDLTSDTQAFSCTKSESHKGFVAIEIQLNQNLVGPIEMPSSTDTAQEITDLRQRLSEMTVEIENLRPQAKALPSAQTELAAARSAVSTWENRLNSLRLITVYLGDAPTQHPGASADYHVSCAQGWDPAQTGSNACKRALGQNYSQRTYGFAWTNPGPNCNQALIAVACQVWE